MNRQAVLLAVLAGVTWAALALAFSDEPLSYGPPVYTTGMDWKTFALGVVTASVPVVLLIVNLRALAKQGRDAAAAAREAAIIASSTAQQGRDAAAAAREAAIIASSTAQQGRDAATSAREAAAVAADTAALAAAKAALAAETAVATAGKVDSVNQQLDGRITEFMRKLDERVDAALARDEVATTGQVEIEKHLTEQDRVSAERHDETTGGRGPVVPRDPRARTRSTDQKES